MLCITFITGLKIVFLVLVALHEGHLDLVNTNSYLNRYDEYSVTSLTSILVCSEDLRMLQKLPFQSHDTIKFNMQKFKGYPTFFYSTTIKACIAAFGSIMLWPCQKSGSYFDK